MEPPNVRLNAPLVRALMWGANIGTDEEFARLIGVSASQTSRVLAGKVPPSLRVVDAVARLWPLVPYARLVVPADEIDPPQALGLDADDIRPGTQKDHVPGES